MPILLLSTMKVVWGLSVNFRCKASLMVVVLVHMGLLPQVAVIHLTSNRVVHQKDELFLRAETHCICSYLLASCDYNQWPVRRGVAGNWEVLEQLANDGQYLWTLGSNHLIPCHSYPESGWDGGRLHACRHALRLAFDDFPLCQGAF